MRVTAVTTETFLGRLQAIQARLDYQWRTLDEARGCLADLRLKQQELRALKSDIKLEMQHVRAQFTNARAKVVASPVMRWFKAAARDQAMQRATLTQQELKVLEPYKGAESLVDGVIHQLNYTKLEIDRWIVANKPSHR